MWLLLQRFSLARNRGTRPGRPIPCRSEPERVKTKIVQWALLHKQQNTLLLCSGLREGNDLIDAFTTDSVDPSIRDSSEGFNTPPPKPVPFFLSFLFVLLFGSGRSRQRSGQVVSHIVNMSRGNFEQTLACSRDSLTAFP